MNPTWEKILLDSTVGYDPEIRDLVADYMDKYKDRLGQVIGATTVDLDARKDVVRSRESNLGNLVADSWLAWFAVADIALVSGGSIRGDKTYSAGPITYLIVNKWTASGGDGHYIFLGEDISKENTTMFTTDILAGHIQRHTSISPQIDGRIEFVGK